MDQDGCGDNIKAAPLGFEIKFKDKRPGSAPPRRVRTSPKVKDLSAADIEKRQQEAEKRRQEQAKAKLDRIHQRQEDCRKVNKAASFLLEQGAHQRKSYDEQIERPVSRQEMRQNIRILKHGLNKMMKGPDYSDKD